MNFFSSYNKVGVLLALMVIALLMNSCVATKQEIRYLNNELVAANKRISDLENNVTNQVTDLYGETDKIKAEIEDLTAQVEDNRMLLKRIVERDTTEQDALKADVEQLKSRMNGIESELKKIQSQLGIEPSPEAKEGTSYSPPQEETSPTSPQGRPRTTTEAKEEQPENQLSSQEDLYQKALATYKGGAYEEAIEGFEEFLEAYPNSELADNAQFWIGESLLALKQYKKAILAYEKVKNNYPNGNKVANAMLREALAFEKIEDKTSSRLLLKKIVKNYPESREAEVAKTRLGKME